MGSSRVVDLSDAAYITSRSAVFLGNEEDLTSVRKMTSNRRAQTDATNRKVEKNDVASGQTASYS